MQTPPDSQIDLIAESRKTELLYRNALFPQIPHMLLCVASAYINVSLGAALWPSLIWMMVAVGFSGLRLSLSLAYRKAKPDVVQSDHWKRRYFFATVLSGLTWGVGTAYFICCASETVQAYNALILCGLIAGGIGTLSPVLPVVRWFTVMVLAPGLAVMLWQADGPRGYILFLGMALLFVLVFLSSRNLHEALDDAIHLELKQHALVVELEEAKFAAEAANKAKGEFLANMSHEIRTPLNGVLGMADIMKTTELSHDQQRYLDVLQASGKGLLTIINDILDLSRVQSGKTMLELHEFDVRELLFNAQAPVVSEVRAKGLSITCELDSALPAKLIGDPDRLRQILVNLVSNAVKFTAQGSITLSVDAGPMETSQMTVYFSVHDTGIGIAPEYHQRIFEAFSQADGSITRRYGGTGLGLTICKHLVELMQGRIWVESEPGKGSSFHFAVRLGLSNPAN